MCVNLGMFRGLSAGETTPDARRPSPGECGALDGTDELRLDWTGGENTRSLHRKESISN